MSRKLLFKIIYSAIISVGFIFAVSCASEEGGSAPPSAGDTEERYMGAADAGQTEYTEDGQQLARAQAYIFPENVDFEGQNIRILNHDRAYWAWSELMAETMTGEPINDAIYTRNAMVEEGLNVTITEIHVSDAPGMASRSIMAGLDEFDVVFTDSSQAGILASRGMYLNLRNVPGLNLDALWWNQNANQSAELLGRLFFTTSDASLVTNDALWVLYFNTVMLQDLQLPNPYDLVREGRWTMDALYDMVRAAARDVNGSGVWGVDDIWGISSHHTSFLAFFLCQGQQLIRRDDQGHPYLVTPDERFLRAHYLARRLMDYQHGLYLSVNMQWPGRTADLGHATATFMNNMSLFCAETLSHARRFREMTADFGLLPHPKTDEHQENHYTLMIGTIPAFGIPITVADPEKSGIFMDAFTGVSADVLMPAYYDVSLAGRFTRDEDSVEMLDIIREGRRFELAVLYNWADLYRAFTTHGVSPGGENPIVFYETHINSVTSAIQQTLDRFMEID